MRKPVVWIKPDLRRRAKKRIVAQIATITTKIQVESTVFVTADNGPLSANACGGIDRICGALCASMFAKIIDEIFELQEVSFFGSGWGETRLQNRSEEAYKFWDWDWCSELIYPVLVLKVSDEHLMLSLKHVAHKSQIDLLFLGYQ